MPHFWAGWLIPPRISADFAQLLFQRIRSNQGPNNSSHVLLSALTFTAVTRVQIPSGTPNFFNSLAETTRFRAGTKKGTTPSMFAGTSCLNDQCFCGLGRGFRRHKKAQNRTAVTRPPPSRVQEPNHLTLRFAFLTKEGLSVSIQRDPAGRVT